MSNENQCWVGGCDELATHYVPRVKSHGFEELEREAIERGVVKRSNVFMCGIHALLFSEDGEYEEVGVGVVVIEKEEEGSVCLSQNCRKPATRLVMVEGLEGTKPLPMCAPHAAELIEGGWTEIGKGAVLIEEEL